ncbi:MAG: hypothetical protein IPM96_04425 [Ignavibacteria bacterium]|nr:hypothetical protein [Ignavibacteria bacterium]
MKDVFSSFRTPIIYLTLLITVIIFSKESISQVCTNTSVGLTRLMISARDISEVIRADFILTEIMSDLTFMMMTALISE